MKVCSRGYVAYENSKQLLRTHAKLPLRISVTYHDYTTLTQPNIGS